MGVPNLLYPFCCSFFPFWGHQKTWPPNFPASRHIRYVGRCTRVWVHQVGGQHHPHASYKPEPQKEWAAKRNNIGRVLNMLTERKVKATERCVVHVHKATYSYYICTWCDVGVHYAITGLHIYTGTGTSCGSL